MAKPTRCQLCGDADELERQTHGPFKGDYLCANCQEGLEEEGLDE